MKCNAKASCFMIFYHCFDFFQRSFRKFTVTMKKEKNISGTFFCAKIHLVRPAFFRMQYFKSRSDHRQCCVCTPTIDKNDLTLSL